MLRVSAIYPVGSVVIPDPATADALCVEGHRVVQHVWEFVEIPWQVQDESGQPEPGGEVWEPLAVDLDETDAMRPQGVVYQEVDWLVEFGESDGEAEEDVR